MKYFSLVLPNILAHVFHSRDRDRIYIPTFFQYPCDIPLIQSFYHQIDIAKPSRYTMILRLRLVSTSGTKSYLIVFNVVVFLCQSVSNLALASTKT